MRINSVVLAVCIGFAANHASAASVTKIDLSFNGLNLTRFGGPVGALNFQISVPDDAIDLSPESPRNGVFEAAVKIGFGGVSEYASGWIQLRDQIDKDSLFLTVRFPSGAIPGTSINTALYGIDLGLYDLTGTMLSSQSPHDMASNFATHITGFSNYFRISGWEAGAGSWREFTGDSLNTASFESVVTHVTSPVPEPSSSIMFLSGIVAVLLAKQTRGRNLRSCWRSEPGW